MLFQLLYFVVISFFCILWGLRIAVRKKEVLTVGRLLLSFFAGLSVLSVLSSWIGLFIAVRFELLLLFSIPVIFLNFFRLRELFAFHFLSIFRKLSKAEAIFISLCFVLFCFLSTGKPTMEDTDLYHIQNIKWIHEYGTVPGLANLYLRFGFYSNWFHLISFFDIPFLNKNFLYLNFTFVVWLFLFLFYQYKKYKAGNSPLQKNLSVFFFLLLVFMLLDWNLFRVAGSSTSYDFVVSGIGLLCISLLIEKVIFKTATGDYYLLLLLLTVPFYKLTGFLLVPLWWFLFFYSKNKFRVVFFSVLITVTGLTPLLIKNYIQTGYPLFPYHLFSFLKPDWQVPASLLHLFNRYIVLSNHYINQPPPGFPPGNGSSFSFYRNWFLHLTRIDQLLIVFCIVSFPLLLTFVKKAYRENRSKILFLYLLCVPSFMAWLIASPDTRFAFGFLLFMIFFPLAGVIGRYFKSWMAFSIMMLLSFGIAAYIFIKGKQQFTIENFIYPTHVDIPPYQTITINNCNYNIPEIINNNWNQRCINTPLPCIYVQNPFLQPRGNKIKKGFKMDVPDSGFILNYYY